MFISKKLSLFLKKEREAHNHHLQNCTSLCCASKNCRLCITELCGPCDEIQRLRDLGLHEGALVTVLQDGDPLLIRLGECRLGIGRTAAMNIMCIEAASQ